MIDLHCHILPGIDDGAAGLPESVAMARELVRAGYRAVIATPHVMPATDQYNADRGVIAAKVAELEAALAREGVPLQVYLGAEYYLDRPLSDLARLFHPLATLAGSHYVLIEFPVLQWPAYLEYSVLAQPSDPRELQVLLPYLRPVVAHPERYQQVLKDWRCLRKLREMGYYFQVNLESIMGWIGRAPVKAIKKMAGDGLIDFLGTDGHRRDGLAKLFDGWRPRVEKVVGKECARRIIEDNPQKLLLNEPIEFEE